MTKFIKNKFGFSLVEIMVILFILTVALAANAPLMTTQKSNTGLNSEDPWRMTANNDGTFFVGSGDDYKAMIGQRSDNTSNSRLIINTRRDKDRHIIFNKENNRAADLWFHGENLLLGSTFSNDHSNNAQNTAFGSGALAQNAKGKQNVALGALALNKNIGAGFLGGESFDFGSKNVAIGHGSLSNNIGNSFTQSRASKNIAIGKDAMLSNSEGNNNIAMGWQAQYYGGNGNIAIGERAGWNGTGNISIGQNTLHPGIGNVGTGNIALGENACQFVQGSNKICIGKDSGPEVNTILANGEDTKPVIYLGTQDTTVSIQGNLVVNGLLLGGDIASDEARTASKRDAEFNYLSLTSGDSGILYSKDMDNTATPNIDERKRVYGFSNSSVGRVYNSENYTGLKTSDRRLKNIKGENTAGLEKIRKLKVFDFTFKKDENNTPRVGVMAQDLKKIFPHAVIKGEDGYLQIRMEDMFYALVNAVKQLDKMAQALLAEEKIVIMEWEIFKNDIKSIKQDHIDIQKRLDKLEEKVF